jgi:hypothetical protein
VDGVSPCTHRLWPTLCLAALASVVALVLPAGAAAVLCAPPGNSGVDQYFETIPGASCNAAPPGSGGNGGAGGHLPPAQSGQLAAQGPAGRAVERLVSSTAPAQGQSAKAPSHTGRSRAKTSTSIQPTVIAPQAANGQGPVGGLVNPIVSGSASGGIGILLPICLAGALVIAVAVVLRRLLRRP